MPNDILLHAYISDLFSHRQRSFLQHQMGKTQRPTFKDCRESLSKISEPNPFYQSSGNPVKYTWEESKSQRVGRTPGEQGLLSKSTKQGAYELIKTEAETTGLTEVCLRSSV